MLNITKLWCGTPGSMDNLRYSNQVHQKPVVVWNSTQRCNLQCIHCYSNSENKAYPKELTTQQAKDMVMDLASFGAPVLLFSGGEPLLRHDLFEVAKLATSNGIRAVLSTNGTLITPEVAGKLEAAGFSYVGVSIDGIEATNDKFRGGHNAFKAAIQGIQNCQAAGVKPGLRFTVTKYNYPDLLDIFELIEKKQIPRVCFYHLAYAGRGSSIANDDLTPSQTRDFMKTILMKAEDFKQRGIETEILTVDNHTDAAYLYINLRAKNPVQAQKVLELLKQNGGNSSGAGIGCIDAQGNVHIDQFWRHYTIGNILEKKFSEIWTDNQQPMLHALRNRKTLLRGRCGGCRFLDICNGNLRVRAEAIYGDVWAPDP
ncbi:MAG TPA: radical SAM protein, partial [Candidatus Acidoferrales bacterium]|nr:radical SAM protein [Candidatus Acidoferrales bacterium]